MVKIIDLKDAPPIPIEGDPQWEEKRCQWAVDKFKKSGEPHAVVKLNTGHGRAEAIIKKNTTADQLFEQIDNSAKSLVQRDGEEFFSKIDPKTIQWKSGELIFRSGKKGENFNRFFSKVLLYGDALSKDVPHVVPIPFKGDEKGDLTITGETALCYARMLAGTLDINFVGRASVSTPPGLG